VKKDALGQTPAIAASSERSVREAALYRALLGLFPAATITGA